MKKTFVEQLWEKNPELVEKQVKNICRVNEMYGDEFYFNKASNGVLKFEVRGRAVRNIYVGDFAIRTTYSDADYENSPLSSQWRSFMYGIYDKPYAMQYISKRNQQLDKFMADYEEKYNAQTRKTLDQMGFELDNGHIK